MKGLPQKRILRQPGANGVIFTPWLHGNRCPFEDSNAGGMFFNIRIENGKRDMIRAVLEGICYHLRWLLESVLEKDQNIRYDQIRRRRSAVPRYQSDALGYHRTYGQNGKQRAGGGRSRRRSCRCRRCQRRGRARTIAPACKSKPYLRSGFGQ